MTYSNRRRLIWLIRSLIFNLGSVIPFLLGVVLSFLLFSSTLMDVANAFDKSQLFVCKLEQK